MQERRHYYHQGAVFILEALSDSVVRVTHREQSGCFGFNRKWDPSRPFTWTVSGSYFVHDDGIDGMATSMYATPDAALEVLCDWMLADQRKEDARRINPEERKRAARKVLGEFLEEIPV